MNPDEAVRGFKLTGASWAAGHHWGTFKLTDEGIERPLLALDAALREHGVTVDRLPAAPTRRSVGCARVQGAWLTRDPELGVSGQFGLEDRDFEGDLEADSGPFQVIAASAAPPGGARMCPRRRRMAEP